MLAVMRSSVCPHSAVVWLPCSSLQCFNELVVLFKLSFLTFCNWHLGHIMPITEYASDPNTSAGSAANSWTSCKFQCVSSLKSLDDRCWLRLRGRFRCGRWQTSCFQKIPKGLALQYIHERLSPQWRCSFLTVPIRPQLKLPQVAVRCLDSLKFVATCICLKTKYPQILVHLMAFNHFPKVWIAVDSWYSLLTRLSRQGGGWP